MIIKENELNKIEIVKPRNGKGILEKFDYLKEIKIYSKLNGFDKIVLKPGVEIGYHQHIVDEELYYILKGKPTVKSDEIETIVDEGTVIWTGKNHFHGIINNSLEDVIILAFIVKL